MKTNAYPKPAGPKQPPMPGKGGGKGKGKGC